MTERSRRTAPRLVVTLVLSATALFAAEGVDRTFLADLPPDVLQTVRGNPEIETLRDDPQKLLDLVFQTAQPYKFHGGPFSVQTDPRWFATSTTGEDSAGPMLELRRWPGDTVLALYALTGEAPQTSQPQPIAGAKLEAKTTSAPDTWKWQGTIDSPFGARPAVWIERRVPDTPSRIGALLLPGDAGLGFQARFDLAEELVVVLDRVEVNPEEWKTVAGLPASTPLVPPRLDSPFGEGSEGADTWQVVEGVGYSLALPPGVRACRLDIGVPAPGGQIPGAVLWLRGRYMDQHGERVVIGDGVRAGYVAELHPYDRSWPAGKTAPLGAPKARLVGREAYQPMEAKRTGAATVWAERWQEPGFEGEWLVFRLDHRDRGVEIGLPVLSGRQSISLFWLPLAWRGPGLAAAPPPVDPAERFGFDFKRFTKLEQRRHPWSEGFMRVPGLRMELPKRWWPSAMMRSKNGFPVRIVDASGHPAGHLVLLPSGAPELNPPKGGAWETVPRPAAYRAAAVYRRFDGARLYVTHEGYGFLLEPVPGAKFDKQVWERMAESVLVVLPRS